MNVVEACVTDLKSAKAAFLAIKAYNRHFRWLHVKPEAYQKIKSEMGRSMALPNGYVTLEYVDKGRTYRLHITDNVNVIRSHLQYDQIKEKGFQWLDPKEYPLDEEP